MTVKGYLNRPVTLRWAKVAIPFWGLLWIVLTGLGAELMIAHKEILSIVVGVAMLCGGITLLVTLIRRGKHSSVTASR